MLSSADARNTAFNRGAATARVPATPTPTPTIRPSDTFTRADGLLNGTAVQVGGGTWHDYASEGGGGCGSSGLFASVVSNKALFVSGGDGVLWTDSGYSDGLETVTINPAASVWGLLFRYTHTACNNNDGLQYYANGGGCVFLQEYLNGSPSGASLAVACPTLGASMTPSVNYNGTTVTAYIDGSMQFSTTTSVGLTNTYVGFFSDQNGVDRFTNWSIAVAQ